jgi:type I restriction-modification system DNA methylase subunit
MVGWSTARVRADNHRCARGLLFKVLERFKNADLHPDRIDKTSFEALLRKFDEALNENPGEHFTPRDIVHLMSISTARHQYQMSALARQCRRRVRFAPWAFSA